MSDYNSGMPIRSQADGTDERVHVKLRDSTNPALGTTVDSDGNAHVEMHGNDPAAVDRVIRTSEQGALTPDGLYNVSTNSKPGNVGIITHTRSASPGDTTQNKRPTSVTGTGNREAIDVALSDENGAPFTDSNPLPVTFVDSEGVETNDYNTVAAVAANGTSNHDYTVTVLKTLKLSQILATASGKMKIEVQIESGVATNIFATKFVNFNSTAHPNMTIPVNEVISVAAGVRVRIIRTNKDNQPQDVYSTISGHEV